MGKKIIGCVTYCRVLSRQISMSVMWIPARVTKTRTVTTLADLTVALADRDLLEMDPPVQVKSVIFLSGHFFYENTANEMQCHALPVFSWSHGLMQKREVINQRAFYDPYFRIVLIVFKDEPKKVNLPLANVFDKHWCASFDLSKKISRIWNWFDRVNRSKKDIAQRIVEN